MDAVADSPPPTRVALGIVVDGGLVLICRRPLHVPLPGVWEFPGGKIEPGETPVAAAVREVKEETGLDVIATAQWEPSTHDYSHARVTLIPVLCRPRTAGQTVHGVAFRWLPPADLPASDFPAGNGPLLTRLAVEPLQPDPTPVIFDPAGD